MTDQPRPAAPAESPTSGRMRTPFDGPDENTVSLDFGLIEPAFLASLADDGRPNGAGHKILPDEALWAKQTSARPVVPVPLCEFLAYRAALAYRDEATIETNLGPHDHFKFFNSQGSVADTQGYGFVRDGTAFIIMRGTESRGDWSVNLDDALTETLAAPLSWWRRQRLRWRYGGAVLNLVDRVKVVPGRHRGFALAWAAVEDQVLEFLGGVPAGTRIVLSGHSLGGALAQIGAFELVRTGHHVAAVVTFGAPLVGNATFKAAYDAALGARTVLLEAKGDSVPVIMRRWYYRLNRDLQQFVLNLIEPPETRIRNANFITVGTTWPFAREPALRDKDIESAIRAIIAERERVAREAEEREKKAEKKEPEKPDQAKGAPEGGDKKASPESRSPGTSGDAKGGETAPGTGKTGGDSGGNIVLMIFAAIAIVIVLIIMWVFIRGKLSSHAIMNRYALFLSTLSYQRIRSLYANAPHAVEDSLKRADGDLGKYLRFIRGVGGDYKGTAYETVADLPVRVKPTYDLATLTSVEKHII